jgi:hypothetical protein
MGRDRWAGFWSGWVAVVVDVMDLVAGVAEDDQVAGELCAAALIGAVVNFERTCVRGVHRALVVRANERCRARVPPLRVRRYSS